MEKKYWLPKNFDEKERNNRGKVETNKCKERKKERKNMEKKNMHACKNENTKSHV